MIQLLGTFYANTGGGGGAGPAIPDFTYTGDYQLVNEDDGNWKVYLTSSGTFTPGVDMLIDAFYVSGGGGGGGGTSYISNIAQGGGGGGGGYTHTSLGVVLQANVAYPVVIGSGGAGGTGDPDVGGDGKSGGTTSAFGISIQGGGGGTGGNGSSQTPGLGGAGGNTGGNAVSDDNGLSGKFGALATLEFGEEGGVKYSGGGGGGGAALKAGGAGGAGGSTDNTGGGAGLPGEQSSPQQTGPYGAKSGNSGVDPDKPTEAGGGGGYGGGYGGGGGGGGGEGWGIPRGGGAGGNGAPGILVLRTHRTPDTEGGSAA